MDDRPATFDTIDILALLKHLPHRYPFLMIDRIVDVDGDNSAVGIKNVTFNEPHFAGHFPQRPIMPGVLLIEGMAQTAAAICVASIDPNRRTLVYFMAIDRVKFRRLVVPGDTVEYHVRKMRKRKDIWKFACRAMVSGDRVAEAVITAMLVDETDAA